MQIFYYGLFYLFAKNQKTYMNKAKDFGVIHMALDDWGSGGLEIKNLRRHALKLFRCQTPM